jgi:hypothetical protein
MSAAAGVADAAAGMTTVLDTYVKKTLPRLLLVLASLSARDPKES